MKVGTEVPHGVDEYDNKENVSDDGNDTASSVGSENVSVFEADDTGNWLHKGKGIARVVLETVRMSSYEDFANTKSAQMESVEPHIQVISFRSGQRYMLLSSKIVKYEDYTVQSDSILIWTDHVTGATYALSFSSAAVFSDFERLISHFSKERSDVEAEFISMDVTLGNLDEIEKKILDSKSYVLSQISGSLMSTDFLPKLFEIFDMCEEFENEEKCRKICSILEKIILTGNDNYFKFLVDKENIMKTIGVFEYDPKQPFRMNHRVFLNGTKYVHERLNINAEVLEQIKYTFRLGYLRDRVMARMIEDSLLIKVSRRIALLTAKILHGIFSDIEFLMRMFEKLKSADEDTVDYSNLLFEIGGLINSSPLEQGKNYYESLFSNGLIECTRKLLFHNNVTVRYKTIDFYSNILLFAPTKLREILLASDDSLDVLRLFILVLQEENDEGCRLAVSDFLTMLLDTETMREERVEFLSKFYFSYIKQLAIPLTHPRRDIDIVKYSSLLDILRFCISKHKKEMTSYLTHSTILASLTAQLANTNPHIRLSLVQFISSCITLRDDGLYRVLIGAEVFKPLLDIMLEIGEKNTMLSSSIIHIFEEIRVSQSKTLIEHLYANFRDEMEELMMMNSLPSTFRTLILYGEKIEARVEESDAAGSQNPDDTSDVDADFWDRDSGEDEANDGEVEEDREKSVPLIDLPPIVKEEEVEDELVRPKNEAAGSSTSGAQDGSNAQRIHINITSSREN